MTDLHPRYLDWASQLADLIATVRQQNLRNEVVVWAIRLNFRKLADIGLNGKGKYRGHPHWTKSAFDYLQKADAVQRGRIPTNLLRHEHAIPVAHVAEELLTLPFASTDAIASHILARSVVVIMTEQEADRIPFELNKAMPHAWDGIDVFARYRACGLYDSITRLF